ncbi:SufB/SufD family protein [Jannaschia sp. LMIT008]|uniref:SufB/SufD family protein n=1 Tax=Jannaschia maritima TaxID=3032585 RepID=UPI002810CF3E|nr:SufD family Fe-S cluster assembly protein [Jannaschia sp. LMIT008]
MAAPAMKVADDRLATLPDPQGQGWLVDARRDALDRLRAVGLPGRRDEYWRYTDPRPFTAPEPRVDGRPDDDVDLDLGDAFLIEVGPHGIAWDTGAVPEGLEIDTLSRAGEIDIHWARDLYGTLEAAGSRPVSRPLGMLTTAAATDGVLLRAFGVVDRRVHVTYAPQADAVLHHVVRVEADAAVTIVETGNPGARHDTAWECDVADAGALHHVRIQGRTPGCHANTHVFARLGAGSILRSFTLSAGGDLTRNEATIDVTGDDASATIGGAAFGEGAFHHDDTVFVTHGALNGESRQVFKKVLRSGATGVFQGKILVKEGAQKTDGYQISQSLLLDDDAVFLAKPELEIYADDVACSHGSTTGAIDETALFYLRSRGVPHDQAVTLLVLSFLAEAVDEIEDEALRAAVTDLMAEWLRG